MNYSRIFLGGILGGVVANVVSIAINAGVLGARYEELEAQDVFLKEPRLPFLFVWIAVLFFVSIGLVWLYAAARKALGPGPKTALAVGLAVGLIAAVPSFVVHYSWSHFGGYISGLWALDTILGSTLATLAGAWAYKE